MTKEVPPLKYRLLADLALLIITAIWGSTFVMVDAAIETMNVLVFIALRFSSAFVVLIIIFGYQLYKNRINWRDASKGAIIGLFLFIGYIFQTFGLDLGTEPGKAAFITGLYVVLVPIFSSILLRKKPHWLSWIGISVAVIGLGLLSLKSITSFQFQDILGDLMVFVCTFGFAFHIIFTDKYVQKTHYTTLTVFQIGTTAILAWIAALIFSPTTSIFAVPVFPITFNKQSIFAILFTGILATAIILAVQTFAQKKTSPTHVAVIFAMEPVFGALFAFFLVGETLLPRQWIGCALILISMIFQQFIDIYFKPKTKTEDIDEVKSDNLEINESANNKENKNEDDK